MSTEAQMIRNFTEVQKQGFTFKFDFSYFYAIQETEKEDVLKLHFVAFDSIDVNINQGQRYKFENRIIGCLIFSGVKNPLIMGAQRLHNISPDKIIEGIKILSIMNQTVSMKKNFWGNITFRITNPELKTIIFECKKITIGDHKSLDKDRITATVKKLREEDQQTNELTKTQKGDNIVKKELVETWNSLIEDPSTSPYFKSIITDFLLKFSINPIIYVANDDLFKQGIESIRIEDDKYATISLKQIINDDKLQSLVFPDWFYPAFPDVVVWALRDGKFLVNEKLNLTNVSFNSDGSLKDIFLKQIVELYLSITGFDLEASEQITI